MKSYVRVSLMFLLTLAFNLNSSFAETDMESLQEAIKTVRRIKNDIKNAGRVFGVNPEIVAGAILSEHALNVDWQDRWQDRAIRNSWSRTLLTLPSNYKLAQLLQSDSVVNNCSNMSRAFNYWYCVIRTRYALSFLLPTNQNYKNFTNEYFNPNGIGTTFGLGQLSPLRALMVTDIVADRTNIPEIDFLDGPSRTQLYNDLMNPSKVVYYTAATLAQAAAIYRNHGFEVVDDLGVMVTLYNIGNERFHADKRRREGGNPRPNYMGRWAEANIGIIQDSLR